MKQLLLILSFTLGFATTAQAKVYNWICNQERGSEYQFLISFDGYEVTRKGKTWPVSQQDIYTVWHEESNSFGDVSARIYVWDPFTQLLHYKALHFKGGNYFGGSGAAMKCNFLDEN